MVNKTKKLMSVYGAPDNIESTEQDSGTATWNKKTINANNGFLEKLVLLPNGNIQSVYKIDIPNPLVDSLVIIDKTIKYNDTKKEVSVESNCLETNYALLTLVKKLVNGELTIYEVINNIKIKQKNPKLTSDNIYELKTYYDNHKMDCFDSEYNPDRCRA
jgi:hypothetical protein